MALLQLTSAYLQGLKRVALSLTPQVFRPLALIIGVLGLIQILGYQFGAVVIFGLEAVVSLVLLLIMRQFLFNAIPSSAQSETYRTREWLTVAAPMLLMSLVNVVQSRTDIIMLGIFQGTTVAGYYTAASRVAAFVLFGLTTINLVIAPLISELFSQQRHAELQHAVTMVAQVVFLFTLPVALIIIVGGRFILQLFGPEFVVAYSALVILTVGQFINALAGPVGYLMTMTRYQNEAAIILVMSAGLNVGLNAFLIPVYGLIGAALATAGSMIFWNLAMIVLTKKRLEINPTVFRIKRKANV
jgi:O-antigen/teichoic acid export membrane protein